MSQNVVTRLRRNRTPPIERITGPMREFIHSSASSGLVLMAATIIALALANSPLAKSYNAVLHEYIGITVGPFALKETVLHWINDGLMAIFFFLVGLEIKRELLAGELSSLRAAMLPIVAAIGGSVVPALIYLSFNFNGPGASGWGVPMATDIAFALGVLALLGDRVPFALKIFLTAVAIVDDLIAVLVIAIFYSGGVNFTALAVAVGILSILIAANLLGVRAILIYVALGFLVWLAFLESGVHATIAGVLMAWTVPARNRIDPATFLGKARRILDRFEHANDEPTAVLINERQQTTIIYLEDVCEQVQAPLQKMEHILHPWVAFGIMPVFALANAGVALSLDNLGGETSMVALGIIAGLVLGKPIGVLGSIWIASRLGLVSLPEGVGWTHLSGAACLAGIGFTMSLFIASLGFGEGALLDVAKLGILAASLIAGVLGYALLRRINAVEPSEQREQGAIHA